MQYVLNNMGLATYAKLGGVTEDRIVGRYVIRNALLPQITGLTLSLGQVFSGALITEIVFSYPGMGGLLFNAIVNGDYNLIMGITVFSIVGIATAPPGWRPRVARFSNACPARATTKRAQRSARRSAGCHLAARRNARP